MKRSTCLEPIIGSESHQANAIDCVGGLPSSSNTSSDTKFVETDLAAEVQEILELLDSDRPLSGDRNQTPGQEFSQPDQDLERTETQFRNQPVPCPISPVEIKPGDGYEHIVLTRSPWDGQKPQALNGSWLMGFDTEYKEITGQTAAESYLNILSYQYCLTNLEQNFTGLILVEDGVNGRLSIEKVLSIIFFDNHIKPKKFSGKQFYIYAHNSTAEWGALKDRDKLELEVLRSTPSTMQRPWPLRLSDRSRNAHELKVHFRDTMHISPAKSKSLKALSEATTTKKIDIGDAAIHDMEAFLQYDRDAFIEYAVADAVIPVEYVSGFLCGLEDIFGLKDRVPLTLSGATVKAFIKHLESINIDPLALVGKERRRAETYKRGIRKGVYPKPARAYSDALIAESFHGGLNAAFEVGNRKEDGHCVLDIDFNSAYPAALVNLPLIDWDLASLSFERLEQLRDASEKLYAVDCVPSFEFYHVKFRFPDDCMFPCIPINTGNGLVYPLEGEAAIAFPEIDLARRLGADVRVIRLERLELKLDDSGNPVLPFKSFFKSLSDERNKHSKGTLKNMMLKQMMNSLYGKVAQGITDKIMKKANPTPEGEITCPAYASITTSIVRAALLSMIRILEEHGYTVLHATTDGCAVWIDKTVEYCDGKSLPEIMPSVYASFLRDPSMKTMISGCLALGLSDFLSIKAIGDEAETWKTRINSFLKEGELVSCVKGSYRMDYEDLVGYSELDGIEKYNRSNLVTFNQIKSGKFLDYVSNVVPGDVNLDYDFKRELDHNGRNTRPWRTVDDHLDARKAADYIRGKKRLRATPERVAFNSSSIRIVESSRDAVELQILRAVVCPDSPWYDPTRRNKDLVSLLGVQNHDVSNAKRRVFVPNRLPDLPIVAETCADLAEKLGVDLTPGMVEILVQAPRAKAAVAKLPLALAA